MDYRLQRLQRTTEQWVDVRRRWAKESAGAFTVANELSNLILEKRFVLEIWFSYRVFFCAVRYTFVLPPGVLFFSLPPPL